MQEHIGKSTTYTYQSIDKAVTKFKHLCETLDYEYKQSIVEGYPHYEAGGVGFDFRVELNIISSLSSKRKINTDEH
jgi:hypothetical protein